MGFPRSMEKVSHFVCAPQVTFKYFMKWDPMCLTRNGYTLKLTTSFICVFCSLNPLSPSSPIMLALAFLTV